MAAAARNAGTGLDAGLPASSPFCLLLGVTSESAASASTAAAAGVAASEAGALLGPAPKPSPVSMDSPA